MISANTDEKLIGAYTYENWTELQGNCIINRLCYIKNLELK